MPQIRRLWEGIGKAQEWKHPRAPSGKWLWKEKSTEAVLAFLRDTRVGCVRVERRLPEDAGVRTGSGDEGEEGDRKSTRLNSSHRIASRMPSSA